MPDFRSLLKVRGPLLLPGAHDALTARMIENAGFTAYGIGGAALQNETSCYGSEMIWRQATAKVGALKPLAKQSRLRARAAYTAVIRDSLSTNAQRK